MSKVHSHYENLKVARDASPDEIRAAYRTLTRKHHPDRNPDNADAERVMAVINVAYGVLSDATKRLEHDRWIRLAEAPVARPARMRETLHAPTQRHRQRSSAEDEREHELRARRALFDRRVRRAVAHVTQHRVRYAVAGVAAILVLAGATWSLLSSDMGVAVARSPSAETARVAGYVRAPMAPNGQHWPTQSGYVDGYPQMNKGGLSEVVVDNGSNDTDMFVKLVSLDGLTAFPARTFFVAAHGHMTLAALTRGTYELRYRNLVTGSLSRSPAFILEEVATTAGMQHTATTVKLYKSADGSMKAYALLDTEF